MLGFRNIQENLEKSLFFWFRTYDSFLAGMGISRVKGAFCSDQISHKPVPTSLTKQTTAYCPKIHTVAIIQLNLMVDCSKKTVIARNCCPIHVCSHFYFDIKFGDSDYMDQALVLNLSVEH